ncbi:MAG TPA: KamA family radical SAM protein [Halobacteria archaeon]|nr:KamA family radical SAM protein [Halobacteria archaeon]
MSTSMPDEGDLDSSEERPPPKSGALDEFLISMNSDISEIQKIRDVYPMRVTKHFLSLIKEKDDPIWRQCIPSIEELRDVNTPDPLMEERDTKVPYLVHRYPDRVLLLVSSRCAMYCRFCTRKRKVGRIDEIPMNDIMRAIDYIREHKEIRDVLISGGDPFMRSDKNLEKILSAIRSIDHVEIIRIGTRMPVVYPARITLRLVNMLKKYHPLYINIHFEHPREIDEACSNALSLLADAGIPLGSQSVLLRGVNDNPVVLKELFQKLVKNRVKPYYLYLCDPSQGVEHFRTTVQEALEIFKKIQGWTTGLCVPHLVIDSPGGGGKIPVLPAYIKEINDERVILVNYEGKEFEYRNP